ncbi:MAG TPA: cysteine desulfurase family protein [Bacillota bacterium]|nr:cysteine desulfurase family protein [Bacillota bacterium]
MKDIYFDHAATTPVHPQVLEEMNPFFQNAFGNPSSVHRFGREVKTAIDSARDAIALSLHTTSNQIIFTSGGTEADNMVLFGIALANRDRGNHIITSSIEHHAVLHSCEYLEKMGFEVTYLPVDQTGKVSIEDVLRALKDSTILISVMYGNNEVGTIQPINEIGMIAREAGVYFHTDAVQAYGVLELNLSELPVDLLSLSSHKINGPKGVGALFMSKGVKANPHLLGGSQEKKRRGGTENVPGIVGFGKAAKLMVNTLEERRQKYFEMREAMLSIWRDSGIEFTINGHPTDFLPHILNVSFLGIDTEVMLMNMDIEGIFCSSGSACTAGSLEPSHVLVAMNIEQERIHSAVRFSFGLYNDVDQAIYVANKVVEVVRRLS